MTQIFSRISVLVIVVIIAVGAIFVWQYFGAPREETVQDIRKYLHKDAILREATPPPNVEYHALSAEEAILFAIQHLKKKGIRNIRICESEWIVAPLGGYLISGKGDFRIGDKHYSTFRIGVRDGAEGNKGEEFAFIARGEDDKGNVFWYPEPGPDFRPTEDDVLREELLVYEFLGDRQKFEALSSRFR